MLDDLDSTSGSGGLPGAATLSNTVVNGGYVTAATAPAAAAQAANPVVSTITVQAASGDAIFKLELDPEAAAAPASYISGFTTAATLLSEAIHDPITVNIEIGYGEYPEDNSPVSSDLALGGEAYSTVATYSQLRSFLSATGASDVMSALAALPNTSSLNGMTNFTVASAEEKVFGQISSSATAIDGYVGFGSGFGSFIVGAALHEFTHAMGRLVGDSVLSLFRYTSSGTHYFGDSVPAPATYFSVDGGRTALADFGENSDPADFLNNALTANDPFDETVGGNSLTAVDRTILDMLGFGGTGLSPPSPPPAPPVAPVVNVQDVSVPVGGWIPGASLITSVSNPSGDIITAYEFEDDGSGGGYFTVNGVTQRANRPIQVLTGDLSSIRYFGGASAGSETLAVAVYDSTTNSDSKFSTLTATTTAAASPADDYRNTYNDTSLPLGNVLVNGSATGTVDYVGDKDVFAVTLAKGSLYTFNVDGFDISSSYTLRDPNLRLLDSSGNVLAANDDTTASNWSSQLVYAAASSGIYYLEAGSSPSDSTYTTGTYQVRVGAPSALTGTATAAIGHDGQIDLYQVTLAAGMHYSLNLDGYDISSSYTLRDPYLQLLDGSGQVLAASDDISSRNFSSEIDYIASTGGTYYLEASSSPSDGTYTTGSYQIRTATPPALAIGATATGAIDYIGARDFYSVTLAAGTHYTFNLDGYDTSSTYTLRDPYLQLLDSNGNLIAAADDISSSNYGSQIDYTATSSGNYYLRAASSPSDGTYTTGSYQIRSTTAAAASSATASAAAASSASGPAIVAILGGDQTVTAGAGPEVFDFSDLSVGNATIAGFDPAQDAIRLSGSLAANLATLQSDMSATIAGTLITLDKTHSITLGGVAPTSLTAANFRFA